MTSTRPPARVPGSAHSRDHESRHNRQKKEVLVRLSSAFLILLLASTPGVVSPAATREPWPTRDWDSASPDEVGLDARVLAAFDADLAAGKYGLVDSMLVIRHGQVAYERSYPHDYDAIYGKQAKSRAGSTRSTPAGRTTTSTRGGTPSTGAGTCTRCSRCRRP